MTQHRVIVAALSALLGAAPALVRAQGTPPEPREPTGWVGISVQRTDTVGKALDYPIILSVEPGSPAAKAGVSAGDTILKFDNIDAHTEPFGIRRLLQPGRHIRLRLRHGGLRTVTVVARTRPGLFAMNSDSTWLSNFWGQSGFQKKDKDADTAAIQVTFSSIPPIFPIAAPASMRATVAVVGALLVQMNAGLAEALHVNNQGVLVVNVAPQTPAMRAGLKGGDVILTAGTAHVRTPVALFQAIANEMERDSDEHRLVLNVARLGKTRNVTLRW